jgi:hypothetical protein
LNSNPVMENLSSSFSLECQPFGLLHWMKLEIYIKPKILVVTMAFHPNHICVTGYAVFMFSPKVCRISGNSYLYNSDYNFFLYCFLQYKWSERENVLPLRSWHPAGRKNLNSSTFPRIQHGMSVLIHDVMALLCVA